MASAPDAAGSAASQAVLDEFLAADVVVIGAPMYNFAIPSQLKAWIDRIAVPGKTFQYGANGPEGLMGAKRVIVVLSRGGFYGAETPMAAFEHVERYLRTVFGFIGVTPEFVLAEGVSVPDARQPALDAALKAVAELKAA
jgi:FMN-dependent NADH-azoreductase